MSAKEDFSMESPLHFGVDECHLLRVGFSSPPLLSSHTTVSLVEVGDGLLLLGRGLVVASLPVEDQREGPITPPPVTLEEEVKETSPQLQQLDCVEESPLVFSARWDRLDRDQGHLTSSKRGHQVYLG